MLPAISRRGRHRADSIAPVAARADGYVRIWSTEAIYNAEQQPATAGGQGDPSQPNSTHTNSAVSPPPPRQLASLSNHSGTIHAVRFSPNGKYVASGADDKIVCIYELDEGGDATNDPAAAGDTSKLQQSSFGTDEPPAVEHWRTILRLIGHDNDVQDLGWSHDSSILVSVGLDSKVVVWSGYTFEKLKTILNHQSLVKGVAFDPANRYFATASDDRTVRVFRFTSPTPNTTSHDCLNNFVLEHTVAAPFAHSPLTTYFRRCDWTPDGSYVVAANAVNGPVTCAALIRRGDWDADLTFIGHEAPVEVCRASPRLYSQADPPRYDRGAMLTTPVVATASDDKALSLWIGTNPRPVIVVQDLATKAFTDLAWSPDGLNLFATALDGSIVVLRFTEKDLGMVVPLEENERCLVKYKSGKKGAGVPESASVLLLEEKSKAGEQRSVEGRMGALMGDHHVDDVEMGGAELLATSATTAAATSTNSTSAAASAAADTSEKDKADKQKKYENLRPKPTYTKDGKKRIAPMLVSASSVATPAAALAQSRLITQSATSLSSGRRYEPESVLDLSAPFHRLPKGGLAALLFGNKRKYSVLDDGGNGDDHGRRVERRVRRAAAGGAVPILRQSPDGT
ncbi:HIR complex subunit, partial [Ascosphaera acerosa]